jgi:multiple sugar transport system substrate-binding protein
MSEKKVTRRGYTKYAAAGVVVVAVAGAGAYYMTTSGGGPAPGGKSPQEDPIISNTWPYRPDLIEENMKYYNQTYNENVQQSTISGDYPSIMETKMISNAPLDHCYGLAGMVNKWYEAGWISDLEGLPNAEEVKDLMYESHLINHTGRDGKLMGMPYFTCSRGAICTNELLLEKAGISDLGTKTADYPTTFDELYDQCEMIKDKGVTNEPKMFLVCQDWVGYYTFLGESLGRGDPIFDENYEPAFDIGTGFHTTLKTWKWMWDEGMFPKGLLTSGEAEAIMLFATGKYAYSDQHSYDLKYFQDPATSQIAGYSSVVPVVPGSMPACGWNTMGGGGYGCYIQVLTL